MANSSCNCSLTERDPVKLCKRLRQLESQGNALALRVSSGPEFPNGYDEVDRIKETILDGVDKLLAFRADAVPVFVNLDPRGYALKIGEAWMNLRKRRVPLHADWGGYGIIAPDLTEE